MHNTHNAILKICAFKAHEHVTVETAREYAGISADYVLVREGHTVLAVTFVESAGGLQGLLEHECRQYLDVPRDWLEEILPELDAEAAKRIDVVQDDACCFPVLVRVHVAGDGDDITVWLDYLGGLYLDAITVPVPVPAEACGEHV